MIQGLGRVVFIGVLCSLGCDSYRSLGPTANPASRAPYDENRMTGIVFDNYYVLGLLDASVKGDSIVGLKPRAEHTFVRMAMPLTRVTSVGTRQPEVIRQLLAAHFGVSPVYEPYGWISLHALR